MLIGERGCVIMTRGQKNTGRGWFGDSEGHRKAGRKGGQARSKRSIMKV